MADFGTGKDRERYAVIALLVATAVAACGGNIDADTARTGMSGACAAGARLRATLHGAIRRDLDRRGDSLECTGMARPDGRGARLRLGLPASADDEAPLAFIFGIPDLAPDLLRDELPTNLTIIEEGSGRFFATGDSGGCWTDVRGNEAVADSLYRVSGVLYCVDPLPALNGNSGVVFGEVEFTAYLEWDRSE